MRLRVTDAAPRRRARRADWQPVVFASEDAKEGATAFVEKRAAGLAAVADGADARRRLPRRYGPPEVVVGRGRPVAAARRRVRCGSASAPPRSTSPTCCSSPTRTRSACRRRSCPGSEFAGVVAEVGDGVADVAVGDRVFGTALVGAFAEEIGRRRRRRSRRIPDGVDDRERRGVRRGPPHRLPRAPLGGPRCSRARSSSCSAPAAASGSPPCSSASLLGAAVTAVASSAEKLEVAAAHGADARSSTTAPATCGRRCGSASRRRRRRRRPRRRRPRRAGAAVRCAGAAGSSPSGYASGEIPRIPLNLVLLKGIADPRLPVPRLRHPRGPTSSRRNEAELLELLADGPGRPARRRRVRARRRRRRPPLRRRRPGHRQGRRRRRHPVRGRLAETTSS